MWGNRSGKKYGNRKIEKTPGHWFDSKAEAALFDLLSLRQRAGEISSLSHHPGTVFLTKARIEYRPDFRYIIRTTGETEHAEFKGFEDQKWPIKKKLWEYYGPTRLVIWRGSAAALTIVETIGPGDAA